MTYQANQRFKFRGEWYLAGDPIELTEGELEELGDVLVSPVLAPEEEGALEAVTAAVDALLPEAFKKDGTIRADALRDLCKDLGFEVTAEDVASIRKPVSEAS